MLVKTLVDDSCIICLVIEWINMEHRTKWIKEEVLDE
jgi:hypothetical protein